MFGINKTAVPASLRRVNQRTIISLLMRQGVASKADLAKAAGMSQPTAGKITSELLELGILEETTEKSDARGSAGPRMGRPGQMLCLNSKSPRFVAIELGVSETCVSALPVATRLEDEWEFKFPTPHSPDAWAKELKKISPRIAAQQLLGVVMSVPGIVDEWEGKLLFSPNLHPFEKVSLPQLIRQVWDLPVLLLQEIRALSLGEFAAGTGEDFFLVDFGQGIGGAALVKGQLYSSPAPSSGEIGHTPVAGNERKCGCGAIGCLETLVSHRGLLETFVASHPSQKASWKNLVAHVKEHGLEPWLRESLNAAAIAIAGAINVMGIRRVVITGSLNEFPSSVLDHLFQAITKGALWARFGEVVVLASPHRRAAGLVAFGLDRLVFPDEEQSSFPLSDSKKKSKSKPTIEPKRRTL